MSKKPLKNTKEKKIVDVRGCRERLLEGLRLEIQRGVAGDSRDHKKD